MSRNGSGRHRLLVTLVILAALFPPPALEAGWAPPNPAFVAAEVGTDGSGERAAPRGYGPSPLDLSHLRSGAGTPLRESADLPSRYDLRERGESTAVRDQAPFGTCWAFAPMASLESTWLKATGEALDLSEWHLASFAFIEEGPDLPGFGDNSAVDDGGTVPLPLYNGGGDDGSATALLARGTGIALEADVPYAAIDANPDVETLTVAQMKEAPKPLLLDRALYLALAGRYPKVSAHAAKEALMAYGALSVGVYAVDAMGGDVADDPYWNDAAKASYVPEDNGEGLSAGRSNHAVTLVGWDDAYGAANFNTPPPGDGAWIVKNSWGPDWGDGGYFYISYHDAVLDSGIAYLARRRPEALRIYQHDPLGWNAALSPVEGGSETAWFANVFAAEERSLVRAVAFYSAAPGASYELALYGGVSASPVDGTPLLSQRGTLVEAGYHTVELADEVSLGEGERFSVVVGLTTPGYGYPVPVEARIDGYSDGARAEAGESYISSDGRSWTDLTLWDGIADEEIGPFSPREANVCLKAFAESVPSASGGGCSAGTPTAALLCLPLLFLLRRDR